ncbi:hypothetical protein GQ44DRAFT_422206 [Phaeosphaeriaceae sp. PMI808]|nr:hypothetical protein GQ44DRAFT_422206 [Phaeosphaeriaceae sp. PMI808]
MRPLSGRVVSCRVVFVTLLVVADNIGRIGESSRDSESGERQDSRQVTDGISPEHESKRVRAVVIWRERRGSCRAGGVGGDEEDSRLAG